MQQLHSVIRKWQAQLYSWLCEWLASLDGVPRWNTILVSVETVLPVEILYFIFFLFQTGYKLDEFVDIVLILNNGLHRKLSDIIKHVRNKYSHKLFHEVATVPLLSNDKLLEGTESLSLHNRETVINFCQAL